MRWKKNARRAKIEDTRGQGSGRRGFSGKGAGGLLSLLPMAFKFLGFKGTLIAAVVIGGIAIMKPGILNSLLQLSSGGTAQTSQSAADRAKDPEDRAATEFISKVKGSVDQVWQAEFGSSYRVPALKLKDDHQGTGPYYMPSAECIYIDPKFFVDLAHRHDSPGDFAQAYVLAHEGAHHLQKLLGLTTFVHSNRGNNELSVRLELYADFLSGVWASKATNFTLEEGDLEEAINAANNIGDDVLMKKAGAYNIDPKKFTHGTGAQRKAWLIYGFRTGDWNACKLFRKDARGNIGIGQRSLMPPAY